MPELVQRASGANLFEDDGHILPLGRIELDVGEVVDCVDGEEADDDDRDGEADRHDRQERPSWTPLEIANHHAHRERNEPFQGTEVSRKSVAALVVEFALSGRPLGNRNLGISKPNTDGDKPAFM